MEGKIFLRTLEKKYDNISPSNIRFIKKNLIKLKTSNTNKKNINYNISTSNVCLTYVRENKVHK